MTAMTMEYLVADKGMLEELRVDEKVKFKAEHFLHGAFVLTGIAEAR
jgi:Cu/Ag efflux protein CusF